MKTNRIKMLLSLVVLISIVLLNRNEAYAVEEENVLGIEEVVTEAEEAQAVASRVQIEQAGNAFINYGQGNLWRVQRSTPVRGTAYDVDGNPAAGTRIEIEVTVELSTQPRTAYGITDSEGNFTIQLVLGSGVGRYTYNNRISYHYYDVVPIRFYNKEGERINANISRSYHFAYQMPNPSWYY